MTSVIILGIGGNCIDIAEAIEARAARGEAIQVAGWLDDREDVQDCEVAGYRVLGRIADASRFSFARFVNGIGSPQSYRQKAAIVKKTGISPAQWMTVVHPSAVVSRHATLGSGTVILANSVIGAGAKLGAHVMVLQNSVISHDATVGDFTTVATGVCISGRVTIGDSCYLGSNCCIREGLTIGAGSLIGLGAVVTQSVPSGMVVAGNPARPLTSQ